MKNQRNLFEGWYFKHQFNGKSLAIIPGRSVNSAFILVVTDTGSFHIPYPLNAFKINNNANDFQLFIENNSFSSNRISLDIQSEKLTLVGELEYSNPTPINGDIMGPFKYFPMECNHGVISMGHKILGAVMLNSELQEFTGGRGYIESDSGRSFPKWYTWLHCNAFDCGTSIMVSVARIPFYGLRFWGCICIVWLNGKEYRLATYKGVKIVRCERGCIELRQGKYTLAISINEHGGHTLPAPQLGKMSRYIRETLSVTARFRFMEGDCCLFDGASDYASHEYMM